MNNNTLVTVEIKKPWQLLSNDLFKSLKIFWLRKDAAAFCKAHGYSAALISRVESRFQIGFIIGVGRCHYLLDS